MFADKIVFVFNVQILTFQQDAPEVKKSAMYSSMQGGQPCFSMQVKSLAWNKVNISVCSLSNCI